MFAGLACGTSAQLCARFSAIRIGESVIQLNRNRQLQPLSRLRPPRLLGLAWRTGAQRRLQAALPLQQQACVQPMSDRDLHSSPEHVLYGFDEDRPSHTSVGLASLVVLLAGLQTDFLCSKSRLI